MHRASHNMTIDSGWCKIMKREAPLAFQSSLHTTPATVFIDGQIKLMKSSSVTTWEQFVKRQFIQPITAYFNMGIKHVVLGFDNYQYVPTAKHVTQAKRGARTKEFVFGENDELPLDMPDDWASAMRVRPFKLRVIGLVARNVKLWFDSAKIDATLVIDFLNEPMIVGIPKPIPSSFDNLDAGRIGAGRGECDIKAFSWLEWGDILIDSTDGDFLPLALVQTERLIKNGVRPPKILIYRLMTKTDTRKRAAGPQDTRREFEYVDVDKLLVVVSKLCAPLNQAQPALSFAALIAMTGCDFCLSLPGIGPETLWKNRHMLHNTKIDSEDSMFLALVVCYREMFLKTDRKCLTHLLEDGQHTNDLYTRITSTDRVKNRARAPLWTLKRLRAHARNVLWTTCYWSELCKFPDPLSGNYGFTTKRSRVVFED